MSSQISLFFKVKAADGVEKKAATNAAMMANKIHENPLIHSGLPATGLLAPQILYADNG